MKLQLFFASISFWAGDGEILRDEKHQFLYKKNVNAYFNVFSLFHTKIFLKIYEKKQKKCLTFTDACIIMNELAQGVTMRKYCDDAGDCV